MPGTLIAQFGSNAPFAIGNENEFVAPVSGVLHLGINDVDFSDNIGSLDVEIILYRP